MLVLCRKSGEAVVLPGCEVTVTVIKVAGKRVKLGVEAPHGVSVLRKEILERPRRELAMAGAAQR